MLILPDSSLRDDGIISAQESLERYKQRQHEANERFRLPDQAHLTNVQARVGIPMSSDEMVKRIVKLNNRLFVEDIHNQYGVVSNFYTVRSDGKKCLNAPFFKGWLPEFTIVHVDERELIRVEQPKTPGWRDVLSRLITAGVLSKSKVDRAFGVPLPNESSTRWFKSTQNY